MRERYLEAFDSIRIDNLHGDRIVSEYAPDGRTSETVFAIQGQSLGIRVGTAITLLSRSGDVPDETGKKSILYRDFHQARAEGRRAALLSSLEAPEINSGLHGIPTPARNWVAVQADVGQPELERMALIARPVRGSLLRRKDGKRRVLG